jgi:hypothetical protein
MRLGKGAAPVNLTDAEQWAHHHAPTCPPLAQLVRELDALRLENIRQHTLITEYETGAQAILDTIAEQVSR